MNRVTQVQAQALKSSVTTQAFIFSSLRQTQGKTVSAQHHPNSSHISQTSNVGRNTIRNKSLLARGAERLAVHYQIFLDIVSCATNPKETRLQSSLSFLECLAAL